jgi:hypothetical protein
MSVAPGQYSGNQTYEFGTYRALGSIGSTAAGHGSQNSSLQRVSVFSYSYGEGPGRQKRSDASLTL